jgi:hypothetical protein
MKTAKRIYYNKLIAVMDNRTNGPHITSELNVHKDEFTHYLSMVTMSYMSEFKCVPVTSK